MVIALLKAAWRPFKGLGDIIASAVLLVALVLLVLYAP